MAGEWITFRLGDVCTKIGSGATPRGGSSVYLDRGDVALIRSQNVYNHGFHHNGLVYLTKKHANELANVEVAESDLLLNITGDSVARACEVHPDVLPARVNQHVAIIRPDPKQLCPLYLRYYLISPAMQAKMLSFAGAGATRNALTKGMIESFEVSAPADVVEQQAIACILRTLDDKIELNRRMNETLEAMARALFKSWFVDFDPVRAKAAGRDPGLPKKIADFFPDAFEHSELGEIPKGWRICRWGDEVTLEYGKSLRDYATKEGPYPVYGTNGPIGRHSSAICQHPGIIIGRKGAYRGIHFADGPFFVIDTAFYIKPKTPINLRWAYYALLNEDINSMDSGSAIPSTSRSDFYNIPLLLPPYDLQKLFHRACSSYWNKQSANDTQSSTLLSIRNVLLPELIPGKLRISNVKVANDSEIRMKYHYNKKA